MTDLPETPQTPYFMTHHAPFGAWSSFTFGLPGHGVSIDHEALRVSDSANLFAGVALAPGRVKLFPFYSGSERDLEAANLGADCESRWLPFAPQQISHQLTPCINQYSAENLTFRVYSPHHSVPDPTSGGALLYETSPGVIFELRVDNSGGDRPVYAFIGLEWKADGRIVPLDWNTAGALCGITYRGQWALAADPIPGKVFTVRENHILPLLENGTPHIHNAGNQGAVVRVVPAGQVETLTCVFGFYDGAVVTQGIPARYWYTRNFKRVEEVCAAMLQSSGWLKQDCLRFDDEVLQLCPDPRKRALFSQSVRAYLYNSQLLEADSGKALYNVAEGQFCWRNTLDLAADHLGWELWRYPWVVRNIMELYLERYSYTDNVRFPGEPNLRPGGMAFTHDMGSYSAYSPAGSGAYEMSNTGGYSFMTMEQVLNGIYCLTSYALTAGSQAWAQKIQAACLELLASLENRDHYDPAWRDGILKGESTRVGERGHEITTYDSLDPSLQTSRGNLYIVVKTWCAGLLLSAYFDLMQDPASSHRAGDISARAARTLAAHFDASRGCFPANLLQPSASLMLAAVEPLAVPIFLGLSDRLNQFDSLVARLGQHIRACLVPGACLDSATGGLRLVSSSVNSWPSKAILSAFVIEHFFGIDLDQLAPSVMPEFLRWLQVAAAEKTVTDQILVDQPAALAGSCYPRVVTSSFWVAPVFSQIPNFIE